MYSKYELSHQFEHFRPFLLEIGPHFANNLQSIHKARNELKTIAFESTLTVVKSFKVPHMLNQLIYAHFRDSKAKKSFQNARTLASLEICTPAPIGYIEFYRSGLLKQSFFVTEHYPYDFTIREPLLDKQFPNRAQIFCAFVAFTFDLHQKGVCHKDYSPGNILIKQTSNGYEFCVVDINRMQFGKLSQKMCLLNFVKLWIDDDDLTIMMQEYARLSGVDAQTFITDALAYSHAYKNSKNLKKRLKRLFSTTGKEV